MKQSILHIGGHADGRFIDVEPESGSNCLPEHYMLRETAPIGLFSAERPIDIHATEMSIHYTLYRLEEVHYSDKVIARFYIDADSGNTEWIKILRDGYKRIDMCPACGDSEIRCAGCGELLIT